MEPEDDDPYWTAVYDARERLYLQCFGPIEGNVQKLMNLSGVWPGGCLIQVWAPRLGCWVTSSFGLTNPDMPARCATNDYQIERDAGGQAARYSMQVVARERRQIPAGLAGYGYEVLLLTRERDFWPLMFLNWAVPAEILRDVDLLGRVLEVGAVTIEAVSLGEAGSSAFLIAPPHETIAPRLLELPNGRIHLLVASAIDTPRLQFALQNGPAALLDRVLADPEGQVSSLEVRHGANKELERTRPTPAFAFARRTAGLAAKCGVGRTR